jgi:hypothetical protein
MARDFEDAMSQNCEGAYESDPETGSLSSEGLPTWMVRPFCRNNTQSEPEDYCHSTEQESEEEEVECFRCCTEYYYSSSKRGSSEIKVKERVEGDDRSSSPAPFWSEEEESEMEEEEEEEEGRTLSSARDALLPQTIGGQLVESFRLVFFVALPMIARQFGSISARRILTRLFGRFSIS